MMYEHIEKLMKARQQVQRAQEHQARCYSHLIKQIMKGRFEPEDLEYVHNALLQDMHNHDLLLLFSKLENFFESPHSECC